MRKIVFMMLLLAALLIATAAWAASVQFNSLEIGSDGNPIILTGKLTKPMGDGPFPALVLLHGSGGVKARRDADWVKRLTNWGYVTLQADSFGPRGVSVSSIIKDPFKVPHNTRAKDAHGARRYLSELPFVDNDRIAVMGWSHGGLSTIVSVIDAYGGDFFKAAIAFYPYCAYSMDWLKAPLLILIGEADDWCPASKCAYMMPPGKTKHEVILKIYPGAYHDFDWKGINRIVKGHRVQYNPEAASDAIVQVKNYLATYLK
jgi:dienelactone hydrolase